MTIAITHALISVSDKTGIVAFAQALSKLGITLLSTGGTAQLLKSHQVNVVDIAGYTGFPEMMDGRVKTLHPKIYAGIMARIPKDCRLLEENHFDRIGLVVVNLYPFCETIAKDDSLFDEAIENIDIGGPTLLRAAAKNFQYTTAVVDPTDYDRVLKELTPGQETFLETRFELATKVFNHVTAYDAAISNYFSSLSHLDAAPNKFPNTLTLQFSKKMDLRYGENPHQHAASYCDTRHLDELSICKAEQLLGKPLSFNNIVDADAGLAIIQQFEDPGCVIIKHANPCAVSLGENPITAYDKAYAMDPQSAFGGIIAFNRPVDSQTIKHILNQQFVEIILAPEFSVAAVEAARCKPNIRLLSLPLTTHAKPYLELKTIQGGLLLQDSDNQSSPSSLHVVSARQPSEEEMANLLFAWQVVRYVKSNAVVYAKDKTTIGIGAGQTSRVFSSKIAKEKAKEAGMSLIGTVMASDAFFPFRDSIDLAARAGITAIIQPGGSMRDEEVIQAVNEHNLAMIFTHIRHFRH